jgi:hypothetical protein
VCGSCRRNAPQPCTNDGQEEYQYFADWPTTFPEESCGEWADKNITPEQEERRELVRRFAVALTSGAVFDQSIKQTADAVWIVAQAMVDAEPGNSGREI